MDSIDEQLLVRTTSDCLKLIPLSFFIILPFPEKLLSFFFKLAPNMTPSTFFQQKYDSATLARKLKAKQEPAKFWQQVFGERTQ
ncbi:MAG: LETM1 domain-containing protein [Candidatus Fonsibacter sp.]